MTEQTGLNEIKVTRGDIFIATLDPVQGSEQGGRRPVIVIQNDWGNQKSPTIIVAPITSSMVKRFLPTHVSLTGQDQICGKQSLVLLEQIRTIDRSRLIRKVGHAEDAVMRRISYALIISLDLRY